MFGILIVLGAVGLSYLSATYGANYLDETSRILLSAGSLIGAIVYGCSTLFIGKPQPIENSKLRRSITPYNGVKYTSTPTEQPKDANKYVNIMTITSILSLKSYISAIEQRYVNQCVDYAGGSKYNYVHSIPDERFMRKLEEQVGIDEKLVVAIRNQVAKIGSFLSPKWKQMLSEQLVNRNEFSGVFGGKIMFIGKLLAGEILPVSTQKNKITCGGGSWYHNSKGFLVRRFPNDRVPKTTVALSGVFDVNGFADSVAFCNPKVKNDTSPSVNELRKSIIEMTSPIMNQKTNKV